MRDEGLAQNGPLELTARALAKHRRAFELFTRPATAWVVEQVDTTSTEVVDLACGIGDPALSLAARICAGRVTAVDRVPEFLVALRTEAAARGLLNVHALTADMRALPLRHASADCVVSRLGIQFAPDASGVCDEIYRVLRPGGTTCHVVWGTPAQPLLRVTVLDVLAACAEPTPAVGVPGPFQFAQPGALGALLRGSGFCDVREVTLEAAWVWPGDAASLWSFTRETSAMLFDPLFARLTAAERERVERRAQDALARYASRSELQIPVQVHCAQATKRD
jgi:ubiquinone/menaquinone biosynthesis C-methylase UbiE